MKKITSNRMWEPTTDFTATQGALLCRLPNNLYGVFRNGRWDTYTSTEFAARFDTEAHLQCDKGGWIIISRLPVVGTQGVYFETITKARLESALARGIVDMRGKVNKPQTVEIEYIPRPTVAIPVGRYA